MRIIWKSQTFLLPAIAGITEDIHSSLTPIWCRDNWQYAVHSKEAGILPSAFFRGKLSHLQIIIIQRCLRNITIISPMQEDTFLLDSAVRCGKEAARWPMERALEVGGEGRAPVSGVTCLPPYQGWASSLFESIVYLNICPSELRMNHVQKGHFLPRFNLFINFVFNTYPIRARLQVWNPQNFRKP